MERQDLIEMRELRRQIWETLVANLPPDTCTDLLCTAVRWQYDTKIAKLLEAAKKGEVKEADFLIRSKANIHFKDTAMIVAANSDGTYHIAFNDGDVDEKCPDKYITKKRPKWWTSQTQTEHLYTGRLPILSLHQRSG